MLTPISSSGATPIMAARERFTRKTLSVSSCTTIRSVIASKISSQWRLACSTRVNSRALSKAMAAWLAMASIRSRSSAASGLERPERQSKPASSPLEGQANHHAIGPAQIRGQFRNPEDRRRCRRRWYRRACSPTRPVTARSAVAVPDRPAGLRFRRYW